jgi:folate-dependent phosphoribosylglycinamide formyltransferase PurN
MTLRIGWFTTGAGPGSQRWRMFTAVLDEIRAGRLDAELAFVFCNRERGENEGTDALLDLVESHHVPLVALSSRSFRRARGGELSKHGEPLPAWRVEYDRAVAGLVESHDFDVAMLAGYMLIFTPEMSRRHPFLNLHPAEPGGPVGTWQEVIRELIESDASRSGVMVHLATEQLDRGPVAAYCTFSLRGDDFDQLRADTSSRTLGDDDPLFLAIRKHGAAREVPLIVATLRALADARLALAGDRIVDREGRELPQGLDLTAEVDASAATEL